ncbi:MAG TPA: GNAT family N-acetyltransferase, partial [Candidatus Tumulicola sp.]|nr:GNAT family N-acetyltransferase [Candidatus Tumulicola sp.]
AFFVHPAFARRGLARGLYAECVGAARAAGFRRIELMATLPGEPVYRALGFSEIERIEATLPGGVVIPLVRMARAV